MGIALYHEMKPARSGGKNPRKPTLDEMGPGVELIPGKTARGGERRRRDRDVKKRSTLDARPSRHARRLEAIAAAVILNSPPPREAGLGVGVGRS